MFALRDKVIATYNGRQYEGYICGKPIYGNRYDIRISEDCERASGILQNIPARQIKLHEETTTYAAGGWCGVAYHSPQLVKS